MPVDLGQMRKVGVRDVVTADAVEKAHALYQQKEPRDLFYRVATELIANARDRRTSLTLGEAVAVLLLTWNKEFFRFHKSEDGLFNELEQLCEIHRRTLDDYNNRTIESLSADERPLIVELFQKFEILGPVGAAKALHLLAPKFFPLWDRKIAEGYRPSLRKSGSNGAEPTDGVDGVKQRQAW